ncbi:glycolate oxidase iron-sulfur subunit [Psychrobacter arcticus 273-4]|uniref:Glycolate oxidase iron-sulfur subunit n=1 Tax=Psychrobacter arcticus (strain DSM 17307 / VKM B-2377 / 273-4) TaxID=259536 RepID=Q4FR58_PSYA2|nr:glycolate oxidase subunit GlcF [Psychrobacter arcticus]AAZ19500.1 glycolate oxidase iron-sulfur subunit [Psychrobacter arcticus 273-4]
MRTQINVKYLDHPDIQEADDILRTCVHCGFCNATCPTYQELGDERDGPRGRIYLLKQMLETGDVSEKSQLHLDRCLTCRSCETTCPSGVKYGRLAEIGRDIMEKQLSRPADQRFKRWLIRKVLPYPNRFRFLLRLGQLFRSFLPRDLKVQVPVKQIARPRPSQQHSRQMLVLEGCAQPSATPNTNSAAARVLDKLGISLIAAPDAGCCGAVSYHIPAHEEGLAFMRRNIDAWWPYIEAGAESIVISASGCGSMVKEYGEKLKHDDAYAAKAERISALTRDLSEILIKEDLEKLVVKQTNRKTAVHCPCSLQHAQQLGGHVEQILQRAGIELSKTQNGHLCCGSAGTYSLLQPKLSQQLLTNKITDLTIENPDQIVTANIGCQLHLGSHASVPVKHWIELLDP